MVRRAFVAALLCSSGIAHAGDKPLYQPAPDWVKPAPEPDTRALGADAPATMISDVQARMSDGQSWSYVERALRLVSIQAVSQAGTIKIDWQPAHGDLIVHGVDILREGKRIDARGKAEFTVLRRETNLERMSIDGTLTATLAVEGLRVGDVLDLRYSVTRKDPTLAGNSVIAGPVVSEPVKLGFVRTRFLWPQASAVKWRAYPVGAAPQESDVDGWHVLEFKQPLARQPDPAPNAPARYARPPSAEATTFADWQSVSKVMEPLYRTKGLIAPGSPLASEVAQIAAREKDPLRRTAAAVSLVQERVRYLFNGMDNGNYVPQSPSQTWQLRYGDCKAKTLLLLAILHDLGIEAEATLANPTTGDFVAARLPSPSAFNHVFVVATVNGQKLWLDGTTNGTYLEDMGDVLPFGWVLPVRADGSELVKVPDKAPARATTIAKMEIDLRGGISIPAPFEATLTMRGPAASSVQTLAAGLDPKQQRDRLGGLVPPGGGDTLVTSTDLSYDQATGTATIKIGGITTQRWGYRDSRYRYELPGAVARILPERTRAIWKDVPVDFGRPARSQRSLVVRLPDDGKGMELEGNPVLDTTLPGGERIVSKSTIAAGTLTLEVDTAQTGAEIAPADFPAVRARAAELRNLRVSARTAPNYPSPWQGIEAAKKAKRYDAVLSRYAAYIADRPEEAARYARRAQFLTMIFERKQAITDLDKAISIQASAGNYLNRARLYDAIGDKKAAIADVEAARDLSPGDVGTLAGLTTLMVETGRKDEAIALLDERIAEGGENRSALLSAKSTALQRAGDAAAAIAAIDAAIEEKPANGSFLNNRCWVRGTLNVDLDAALKDCNRAIEVSTQTSAPLDSRAMVFYRQGKFDAALTDLEAALEQNPNSYGSRYMRGVVLNRLGRAKDGAASIADARLLWPDVDADYARFGIKP